MKIEMLQRLGLHLLLGSAIVIGGSLLNVPDVVAQTVDPTAPFTNKVSVVEGWLKIILASACGLIGLGLLIAKLMLKWGSWLGVVSPMVAAVIIANWNGIKAALFT